MLKHINISIIGDVQGVFFRRTIKHEAERKGINGFVHNEPDGTVYIEAEGSEEVLDAFSDWIKGGAGEGAQIIKNVDITEGAFHAFNAFEIKE